MTPTRTVYFLSDYGLDDEFVGVVHAVIAQRAPRVRVIDLAHRVPAFDVVAGARMLERAVPHLGPGVVLGVVDPGVGGSRRGVVLETAPSDRPCYFVGPDNGLMAGAAQRCGGVVRAVLLPRADGHSGVTFDGRDLFAPAAAALAEDTPLDELGEPFDPADLVQPPSRVAEIVSASHGRVVVRTEVVWIDHFGNVALAATAHEMAAVAPPIGAAISLERPEIAGARVVRRIGHFAELSADEVGLMDDANGAWSLVMNEASFADAGGLSVGDVVGLTY